MTSLRCCSASAGERWRNQRVAICAVDRDILLLVSMLLLLLLLLPRLMKHIVTTLCLSKNGPNAIGSFDKQRLIVIIFSEYHQHIFKNHVLVQLFFPLHLYLLYLLLNSSNGNDAILTSLSVPKLRCSARSTRFWSNICMRIAHELKGYST